MGVTVGVGGGSLCNGTDLEGGTISMERVGVACCFWAWSGCADDCTIAGGHARGLLCVDGGFSFLMCGVFSGLGCGDGEMDGDGALLILGMGGVGWRVCV